MSDTCTKEVVKQGHTHFTEMVNARIYMINYKLRRILQIDETKY